MRKAIILLAAVSAGCSSYTPNLPSIKPYKMDIQQGNVITSKMMLQLKPGMTKPQVRFVMGTPLISDSFHANRWDYFYQMRKDGKVIEQRRVILDFEDDKLVHVRGDVVPARKEGEAGDAPVQVDALPAGSQTVLPKPKEKSWTEKLKFWNSDEDTPKAEEKPAEPDATKPEMKETPKPAAVEQKKVVPVEAAPAVVEPVVQPEIKPVAKPEAVQPTPAPVVENPASKVEMKEEAAPAPEKSAPVEQNVPVKEPVSEEKAAPVAKPVAKAEAKQVPKPTADDDLPPEESPSYFDKMLEKIGF